MVNMYHGNMNFKSKFLGKWLWHSWWSDQSGFESRHWQYFSTFILHIIAPLRPAPEQPENVLFWYCVASFHNLILISRFCWNPFSSFWIVSSLSLSHVSSQPSLSQLLFDKKLWKRDFWFVCVIRKCFQYKILHQSLFRNFLTISKADQIGKMIIALAQVKTLRIFSSVITCGQSYKQFMLINYDSRVIVTSKLLIFTTLDS